MEENSTGKWASGVFLAVVGLIWGVVSLASGRIVIPFFRWQDIALTDDILVSGKAGLLISSP